jgi:hypothetical protein
MQRERVLTRFGVLLLASAVVAATQPALGTPDAALARLFTPVSAPPGRYVVYRSDRPIGDIVKDLKAQDPSPSPGAWEPTRPEAHDAFGQEGAYDRSRLARLFRGQRVTLIRGSLRRGEGHTSYTLISPYPNASLTVIEPGTLVIEFRIPPLGR